MRPCKRTVLLPDPTCQARVLSSMLESSRLTARRLPIALGTNAMWTNATATPVSTARLPPTVDATSNNPVRLVHAGRACY
jgi:hypothetical protein